MKKTVFQMRQVSSFRLTRRLLQASIQKTLHVCLAIGGVRHEHKSITITTKTKVLKKIKYISLSCLLMFVEIISLHHLLFVPSSKLHLFEFLALRRLLNRMNYAQSTSKQWQALMCSPQLFTPKHIENAHFADELLFTDVTLNTPCFRKPFASALLQQQVVQPRSQGPLWKRGCMSSR